MRVDLVYSEAYQASGLEHFERLAVTHEMAVAQDLVRVHSPRPIDLFSLRQLHEPEYVDAVLSGRMPLAGSSYLPWSEKLVSTCLHMLGGQLLGANLARANGIAINLACGFHHAHPGRGGGYCVFNGLALVAQRLPKLQVVVLDCDEHGGDGTEVFCANLPNLSAISIFGTRFGIRGGLRSSALAVPRDVDGASESAFFDTLDQALGLLIDQRPDLLVYQASADSHESDPKSTLRLSTAALAERDRRVFSSMLSMGIPVLVTVAGGYQAPQRVARLYLQTIAIAASALARTRDIRPLNQQVPPADSQKAS